MRNTGYEEYRKSGIGLQDFRNTGHEEYSLSGIQVIMNKGCT